MILSMILQKTAEISHLANRIPLKPSGFQSLELSLDLPVRLYRNKRLGTSKERSLLKKLEEEI